MPELPEVQTTVNGLKRVLPGLRILGVWTDIAVKKPSLRHYDDTIKNLKFFNYFKKEVTGKKILSASRRAKNILIHLAGNRTILVHMKMTGHLLYGKYKKTANSWVPAERGPLDDPYNRFIHFIFVLSNPSKSRAGIKHLAFSDARKFGKITLIKTDELDASPHLAHLGPEPLEKNFSLKDFGGCLLKKPNGKIKQVLTNQSVISGIGNIYSDEILWYAGVHPEERVKNIPPKKFQLMFNAMKKVLKKGIDFGGDSLSDYRNIDGVEGKFQLHHMAYQRTGEKCRKKGCRGVIIRKTIGGRTAHFCPVHQKLTK